MNTPIDIQKHKPNNNSGKDGLKYRFGWDMLNFFIAYIFLPKYTHRYQSNWT